MRLVCAGLAMGFVVARSPGRPAISPGERSEAAGESLGEAREGDLGPAAPGEWIAAQRGLSDGTTTRPAFRRAGFQAAAAFERTKSAEPQLAATRWQLVGPTSIGGRILDIAVDPTVPNTVYAAAATGGVWKSIDAGSMFASVWPDRLSQSIGALAAASDGSLYAGTGEAGPGGGSLTYGGTGVYRSRDHGASWQSAGLEGTARIGRIVVDPDDPKRVFVAATGDLFVPGGQRGLYRSTNGGETWSLVLAGPNATTGVVDVVIDPTNPTRLWAATWDHRREPDLRRYGGPGSGVYRSTDGGTTWEKLAGGLPPSDSTLGRIGLAASPHVPGLVYAIAVQTLGPLKGLYISADGGDSWTRSPATELLNAGLIGTGQSTYGWWFGRIWVDPVVPNRLFAAGLELFESLDGGISWVPQITSELGLVLDGMPLTVHPDQHAMSWDPKVSGRVYLGNDGGFYTGLIDPAGGLTWLEAAYQPFTQFYSVDVSEQDPSRVVGGAQDNGSLRSYGGGSAADGWNSYYGGDGVANVIDYLDHDHVYACYQYGECARSTNGGDSMTSFSADTVSTRRNWFTPIVLDPNNPAIVYWGGNVLNRSLDHGSTWRRISPDLAPSRGRDTQYPFGTITTVAVAKTDAGTLYVGTDDGRVWTFAGGWTQATDPRLPPRWVTRVAVDPIDARRAYATFSGFRSGVRAASVFRTSDGGRIWKNVSGDLPNAPVNDIVIAGERLYVGTDVGVYVSGDDGSHWFSVGRLPVVPVTDIRYHEPTKSLYAATFGRGIYVASVEAITLGPETPSAGSGATPAPSSGGTPSGSPRRPATGATARPSTAAPEPAPSNEASPSPASGEGPPTSRPRALAPENAVPSSRGGAVALAIAALVAVAAGFARFARRRRV